ncbi:MAG: MATE family efflux transporter [Oscillospiraceae bacterium]|nr:MATE family efflux transporter [Oscillospiraceae bacterium]
MDNSQNKLGVMPIGKLLMVMSVPMMISMFIQALYNVVDSMFVAKISEEALAAVGIAFPLQNIAIAIGVGTGVGITALVPRSLGSGDYETANRAANVQNFLCICYSLVFVVIGLVFARPFYTMQTNDPAIIEAGVDYVRIVCAISVGVFFGQGLEKLLVASGYSALSMICQASGAIINIALDPILIFGLGPIPAMGVKGAAIATVAGQIFASALALFFNLTKNKTIRFSLKDMVPNVKTLKAIYAVGIPSMLTVGLSTVMSYCMNQIFLAVGTTATAAFGIWVKLQSFGFMPVYGLNNGSIAILAFNRGAKKYDRVRKTLKLASIIGVCVSSVIMVFYFAAARPLLGLFSASENMYAIGMAAVRICALSLPFGAYTVILSSSFQSLGNPRNTFLVNMCRQLIILVPVAWLLSLIGDVRYIWAAFPVADAATMLISMGISRRLMKTYVD